MTLWIILTALTALAAAWLTIPLVRRHEARVDARAATIAVLKDQLADVDVQLATGSIQPGEAEGLRNEIRRRLLAAGHIPAELDRTMGQKALSGLALGLAAMVAVCQHGPARAGGCCCSGWRACSRSGRWPGSRCRRAGRGEPAGHRP
jgi:cytochrome c-type biogenesis protein CcmH